VDLLARRTRVGRQTREFVPARRIHFSVRLNRRARHALRVRHKLALRVRMTVTPPSGRRSRFTRPVTLKR
jgi:hypothetical protein